MRPPRSIALNVGASIELLASITMRPPKSGNPANAVGNFDQLTATSTMGWAAASSRVPARAVGPSSATSDARVCGPRLLAMTTSMP
ncbi:hypothetical protein D3C73_1474420 [compost metagenome]